MLFFQGMLADAALVCMQIGSDPIKKIGAIRKKRCILTQSKERELSS
jgi:hypothetical protein